MGLKRGLLVAALLVGECIAFTLALLAVFWSVGDISIPGWAALLLMGAVYLVLGGVPVPHWRRPVIIGMAAFLVSFLMLGWIDWRIEYFLIFEHSGAWENLPRVMLAPTNLGAGAFLALCALVGSRLSRHIHGRAVRPMQQPPCDRR
jgi:hypothetical protein